MSIPNEQLIKLQSMQIKGIRNMIWSNVDKQNIENRLLNIKNQSSTDDIEKLVNSQSRATLIKLIEMSYEITNNMIDDAYEKYRYGLKPGFTLFWAKGYDKSSINQNSLEISLKDFISRVNYDDNAKYKNLKFVAITEFENIYEISFSYLQRFNYINEDGEFTYTYFMKECFVWVGISQNFIAINNMPDVLMNTLKSFFSKLYGADITNIKITNSLLDDVFSSDKAKRVTKHNSNPPENQLEKVTFSDPNLSEKQECIPSGYENYNVTNTQYAEQIDENTIGTLGLNCNKGKLYLSKSLTSTQFRNWSIGRIQDIIGYYQQAKDISMDVIVGYNMFSSDEWGKLNSSKIDILNNIAYSIINCKKSNITSFPFDLDTYDVYSEFHDLFSAKIRFTCEQCEEKAIAYCSKCESSNLSITKKFSPKIVCNDCSHSQSNVFSFNCEQGHVNVFHNINDIIELSSTDEFTEKLIGTLKLYYNDLSFSKNEYFVISNGNIELCSSPDYEKLKPSDIYDFAGIINKTLDNDEEKLNKILCLLNEKCNNPTIEKCKSCKNKICSCLNDIGCLIKLFDGFEGYTPQPHQGHEFGDISMLIKINNENKTFLGIAKSVSAKAKKVTKSSKIGREIIQQSLDAFANARTDVIGIIYPHLLDDQLKYLLYHNAKLNNKSLVILDYDFMIRLLDKYISDNQIQI